jgi:Rad3-related DNA helicase
MKMNYGWDKPEQSKSRQLMINGIRHILNLYEYDKGIIHTGNFQIAKWLVGELALCGTHTIMHHNTAADGSRDKVINAFLNSKQPALLISPSITEGLDLVEDLARFCIFVKMPYGQLGDAWIKRRMDINSMWYSLRALTAVMQGCGRIVRNQNDYGDTYIFDESWGYLYNITSKYIPQWWRNSLHKLKL